MSEVLLLAIGAVLFAITTGATVFFGGAALTRRFEDEEEENVFRSEALRRLAELDDDELARLTALRDAERAALAELELGGETRDLEQPTNGLARGL